MAKKVTLGGWWVTPQDLAPLDVKLDMCLESLAQLHRKVNRIMTQVQVAQEDLDQLDADMDAATQAISDQLDALAAAHPELPEGDLAPLRENVSTLQGLSAPASEPVDPGNPSQAPTGDEPQVNPLQ